MSLTGTNYPDIHGGRYKRDRQNTRNTVATRRGLYRATSGLVAAGGQNQLKQIADAFATNAITGSSPHPNNSSLPLATVDVRRIGADLFEYELGYKFNTNNYGYATTVRPSEDLTQVMVPFENELDSGLRWSPNRMPPLYPVVGKRWIVTRSRPFSSVTAVFNETNSGGFNALSDVGKVNNATYSGTIGISFAIGTLMYEGLVINNDDGDVIATMVWSFIALQKPTHTGAPTLLSSAAGHGYGTYRPTNTRPYWAPLWTTPPQVTFPSF